MLDKLVLGLMGRLRPRPVVLDATASIALPPPRTSGGLPLMEAFRRRASQREFASDPLSDSLLSDLLWCACGVNRPESGGRTAPSALDAQEIDVFVALPQGAYRFDATRHVLELVAPLDVRRVTGYQDFVDTAGLDLVLIADHTRMRRVPVAQRESFAAVAAGAIAQNVYLFCASVGLACVLRAWIDRTAIADALGLSHDQHVLLSQTIGYPASSRIPPTRDDAA